MRLTPQTDYRSFYLLNATQFLGALNDNIFKLLVIYLLINVNGVASAGSVLSMAGAIFVIPFLLFSSGAGVLADRLSKRTIIVYTKILEILIMLFGLLAVFFESAFGSYTALFFMATQSAIFGPSKYGIIPELIEPKKVSKANGSLTSFTYLAIILGMFLASFITDITGKNFVLVGICCVFIAIIGFLTSLGIRRTAPQNSPKKINPFFLYEIYQTIKMSWRLPHLVPTIFGSCFFLFIGAFTQMNVIPYAMQSLHLSEVGGGYLFLATAVGIAIGAVLAGQLSKDQVEPGLSCFVGIFIPIFFFAMFIFSSSLTMTIISMALLGIFGGAYLIPFDSYIQLNSPDEKRGQVIAAANFLSFVGVLGASLFLYFMSEELELSAATGFAFMGMISLIVNTVLTGRLSALFLPFFANKILKHFRRLTIAGDLPNSSQIFVFKGSSWWDMVLLFTAFPILKILCPQPLWRQFPWINGWIESIQIVPPYPVTRSSLESLFKKIKTYQDRNIPICFFMINQENSAEIIDTYRKIFSKLKYELVFAHGKKERISKRRSVFSLRKISMSFTK